MENQKDSRKDSDKEKDKALGTVLGDIEKQFGKGAIMKLGAGGQGDGARPEAGVVSTGSLGLDIALGTGGLPLAITCVVFLFVLRQVEDIVIAPIVVGRSVNLHPLVTLFAVVVGTTAFGVLGTFLAVPVAAAVNVALHEFFPAELGPMKGDPGSVEPTPAGAPPPTGATTPTSGGD